MEPEPAPGLPVAEGGGVAVEVGGVSGPTGPNRVPITLQA